MFELLAFALPPKLINFAFAILGIGALVFLHELGHFLAAKYMGMPVEVFSIGFGRRLVGFAWRETDVRLSILPLGGYVKLAGFNPEEPGAEDPHGFLQQPYWKRMLFYSGGIIANLIVAFVLFAAIGVGQANIVQRIPKAGPLLISLVQPASAAAEAGLTEGDEILAMGDLTFPEGSDKDAVAYIQGHPGMPIPLRLRRQGDERVVKVTPRAAAGKGFIGIQFSPTEFTLVRRGFQFGDLGVGAQYAGQRMADLTGLVSRFLQKVVTFKASSSEVGGPLAITRQMSQAAHQGLESFLFLCGAISLQLAILNALPIPMLDGGHMVILTIERLRRRDLSMELKERILTGGFFLVAGLMALVLILDLLKLRR